MSQTPNPNKNPTTILFSAFWGDQLAFTYFTWKTIHEMGSVKSMKMIAEFGFIITAIQPNPNAHMQMKRIGRACSTTRKASTHTSFYWIRPMCPVVPLHPSTQIQNTKCLSLCLFDKCYIYIYIYKLFQKIKKIFQLFFILFFDNHFKN